MAITLHRGYALLISVIIMSVMLTFGLTLGSLAYKQQVLSSGARESHYAFYAADSILECGLYADEQLQAFSVPTGPEPYAVPAVQCGGASAVDSSIKSNPSGTPLSWMLFYRFSLDSGRHCGDLTIRKDADNHADIYAQGYNVSCPTVANPNGTTFVARGMYSSK